MGGAVGQGGQYGGRGSRVGGVIPQGEVVEWEGQ